MTKYQNHWTFRRVLFPAVTAKKLQGEINRVLKAVQEGQKNIEEIWLKVHEASTAGQTE